MNTSIVGLLRGLLLALLLGLSAVAHAQQLEVVVATQVRATAMQDGKVLLQVAKGSKVEQIETRAGWIKVKVGLTEGWVRSSAVKSVEAAAPAPTTNVALNPFNSQSSRPAATTGIRGFTKEDLAKAQPAPREMEQLEKYAINMNQAETFARNGKVVAQRIDAYTGAEK